MKYRKLGSLPWEVSALGFGCMRLPTSGFLKRVDEKYAIEIIRHGIDLGINYVDSAWLYHFGQSEQVLGKALRDGYRAKVKIATKLPVFMTNTAADFDKFLNSQLKRLQTDCIDLYLFHMLDNGAFEKMKKLNLLDKMEAAKKQGKIKHIGFSIHDTLPVFKKIIDHYAWDMTQIQYNYMDTGIQATTEGLEYAYKKGIAVVVMEPLKGGQLVNPPKEAVDVMSRSTIKRSPVDWALQFLWNRPEVACVLSGMGNKKMVDENCECADTSGIGSLSAEENAVITELAAIYRKQIVVPCTACQYCMPCPSGVNIPQNFALLNNRGVDHRGTVGNRITQWLIYSKYRGLSKKRGRPGKDGKFDTNGRASLCTRCNKCVPKCPQHIQIPDELQKVIAVFEKGKRGTL